MKRGSERDVGECLGCEACLLAKRVKGRNNINSTPVMLRVGHALEHIICVTVARAGKALALGWHDDTL